MNSSALFTPVRFGGRELAHRVVMAPMMRMRAHDCLPTDLMETYYQQRASHGGLIVAEAAHVAPNGKGYPNSPGIHTRYHVNAWRNVTDAVHAKGGLIYLQLWHAGRLSHPSLQPDNALPVGPSEISADGVVFNDLWQPVAYETPRALRTTEVYDLIAAYRSAALNALEAGFDGVEIHASRGLIEQFLRQSSNSRQDEFGGTHANRARFLLMILQALTRACGGNRVGVRLSPIEEQEDNRYPDIFRHVIKGMAALDVSYLHLVRRKHEGRGVDLNKLQISDIRSFWPSFLILAGGLSPASAEAAIESGLADAVAFGRRFISNPDLPYRIQIGGPLNSYDSHTFYGGGKVGYTDYPTLNSFLLSK